MSSEQQNQLPALADGAARYEGFKTILDEASGSPICQALLVRLWNGMNKEVTARDRHLADSHQKLATANSSLSIVLKDPNNETVERLTKDMERMASRLAEQDRMLQVSFKPRVRTSSAVNTDLPTPAP